MFTNVDLSNLIYLFATINILILVAFLLRKFTKLSSLITRKFLHISAIFIAGLSFVVIQDIYLLYLLGGIILVGNFILFRTGIFEESGVKNPGILFVPISYLAISFFFNSWREIAAISMWIMAFSDAFAALIGNHFPIKKLKIGKAKKSIGGSLAFFISTIIVLSVSINYFQSFSAFVNISNLFELFVFILFLSVVLTASESLSFNGIDNLIVPIFSAVLLLLFHSFFQSIDFAQLFWGILLATLIVVASIKLKFLQIDGVISAFILGSFVFGLGGIQWTIPILVFYIFSSTLSKIRNAVSEEKSEKGSQRDAFQVLANGGIPGIAVVSSYFFESEIWFVIYLISLSVSTADTWATEFGNLKKRKTINILNFKEIEQGESGGISFGGTLGGIFGASLIAVSGIFWLQNNLFFQFLLISSMGFFGMLIDSVLGSSLQRKNTCVVCKKQTEKSIHCGIPTEYHVGTKWLNNDGVNFISALTAVILFLLISF